MIEIFNATNPRFSEVDIKKVYDIIIKGYELTEEEVWGKQYVRIFPDEFTELVNSGNIHVAVYNNQVAGGIYVYQIDDETYGFGLLASEFTLNGQGIGTALINAAEQLALQNKASRMAIEILRVKGVDVESKLILARYYERLGYVYTHSEDCICKIKPAKYKKLVAPSNFDFYVKRLS